MADIDNEIKAEFDKHLERVNVIFRKTVWAESYYAAGGAYIAILHEEIPECFQWEPVSAMSSSLPLIVLTGYLPNDTELHRKKPPEPKKGAVN